VTVATVRVRPERQPARRSAFARRLVHGCFLMALWIGLNALAQAQQSPGTSAGPVGTTSTRIPINACEADYTGLGPELSYRLDEGQVLDLEAAVRTPELFAQRSSARGFGFHKGNVWVRFSLGNSSPEPCSRWLIVRPALQERITLHLVSADGSSQRILSGASVPAQDRIIRSARLAIFPVTLAPGASLDAYLVFGGAALTDFDLGVWEPGAYMDQMQNRAAVRYLLLGFSALMFFSCLIAAKLQRKPGLLFGAAGLVFALIYAMARDGFAVGMFPGSNLGWQQTVLQVSSALFVGSHCLFAVAYLPVQKRFGGARKLLQATAAMALVMAVTVSFVSLPGLSVLFAAVSIGLITAVSLVIALQAGAGVWIYLSGWLTIWLMIVARLANVQGWLPIDAAFADMMAPATFGISALATSFALYHSMMAVKRDADQAVQALLRQQESENDRLKAAVNQSTAELNDALKQTQAASADKSAFLSMIAHEFHSPLHSVIGYAGLLQRQAGPREIAHINGIDRAANLLLGLVDQTLRFSKGEPPSLELDMGLVHLESLVREVIANQEVKHRLTKGRFRYATAGRTPQYVEADQGRMHQVLDNILANALKYAPDGVIEIKLEAFEHDEKDASGAALRLRGFHLLRFSVRDEGPGIAAEHHAKVFEPFSRLSTSRQKHGLGLGLAICQQILGRLNSTLHLVSRPGQGACFYFDLWLAAGEVNTTQSFADVESQDGAVAPTPPGQLFLDRARQLLELGQLVAIENLAADHGRDHPEFDAFFKQVIACCVEIDLEGLSWLLKPADAAGSRIPADPRAAAGSGPLGV
jgi:signal transduction histidine kinase